MSATVYNHEKMYTYIKGFATGAGMKETLRALSYAREKHCGQMRKSGQPYIVHPLTMACDAVSMGIRDDTVVATIGEHTLTNNQLQVYYWMEVYSFLDSYGQQLSAYGLDLAKPLSEQYINKSGDTWEQYFLKKALNKQ